MVSQVSSTKDWTTRCWQACVLLARSNSGLDLLKPTIPRRLANKGITMPKKPTKTRTTKRRKPTSQTPARERQTKQSAVLALLRRPEGASIEEIINVTNWQSHSVRGFFAGALRRRLGLEVVSDKNANTGERRYHVAALKS